MSTIPTTVSARRAVEMLDLFEGAGIDVCVGGGWGVDALAGEQTREHEDLDVFVPMKQDSEVRSLLEQSGFAMEVDWRPTRYLMVDADRAAIDVHPVRVDAAGDAFLTLTDGSEAHLPARDMAGIGRIGGRPIRCLTAERQQVAHRGYAPQRPRDEHDLRLLESIQKPLRKPK